MPKVTNPHTPTQGRYARRRLIAKYINKSVPDDNLDVGCDMFQIDVPEDFQIPAWGGTPPRAQGTLTASTPAKRGGDGRSPSTLEADIASRVKRIRTDTEELTHRDNGASMRELEEGEVSENSPAKGSSSSLLTSLIKISSTTTNAHDPDTCARVRSYSGESRTGKQ